jgi:hypothetical protein
MTRAWEKWLQLHAIPISTVSAQPIDGRTSTRTSNHGHALPSQVRLEKHARSPQPDLCTRHEVTKNTTFPSDYKDVVRQPVHPPRKFPSFPIIMRGFGVLLAAFVFAYATNVFGQPPIAKSGLLANIGQAATPVESYISKESPIAKSGLLANIGPDGPNSSGAKVCRP